MFDDYEFKTAKNIRVKGARPKKALYAFCTIRKKHKNHFEVRVNQSGLEMLKSINDSFEYVRCLDGLDGNTLLIKPVGIKPIGGEKKRERVTFSIPSIINKIDIKTGDRLPLSMSECGKYLELRPFLSASN